MEHKTPAWVDSDPSVGLLFHDCDDGFALYQAVHASSLKIRGVSIGYGNTSLKRAVRIAGSLWDCLNSDRPALVEGAAGPGLLPGDHPAVVAIANELASMREPVTFVALGPGTLFASVVLGRPDLKQRIQKIIWVAGRAPGERLFLGNRGFYEFHDANFDKDPTSARVLLDSGIPIVFIPVGLGPELMLTSQEFSNLKSSGGPAGDWLTRRSRLWLWLWQVVFGLKGAPVFDCLAVLAASSPELLEFSRCRMKIADGKCPELHYLLDENGPHQVCVAVRPDARKAAFNFEINKERLGDWNNNLRCCRWLSISPVFMEHAPPNGIHCECFALPSSKA